MKRACMVIFLILLIFPAAFALQRSGHLKLLAVIEDETGKTTLEGSTADLYLEILPGSGRVFLDTYPLTKLDTQISTRFAKEIACDYLDTDCNKYDFIYTIRSGSSIIGGPSAGAAITVLTIALLEDIPVDESVAVTGTINSGGIVGNVGAVKQKIEAAARGGIKKALIPEGERYYYEKTEEITNWTEAVNISIVEVLNGTYVPEEEPLDLVEYGKTLGIEVIPVSDLGDVIFEFTGKKPREHVGEIDPNKRYQQTMKSLSEDLCARSISFERRIPQSWQENDSQDILFVSATNLSRQGRELADQERYYSSASFCFGANIRFAQLELMQMNLSSEEYFMLVDDLAVEIHSYEKGLETRPISTITDLEAYMVVKERLKEGKMYQEFALESLNTNISSLNTTAYLVAYARERLNSGYSWSKFFGNPGRTFVFNNESLKTSCSAKLAEAEERMQFVRLILVDFFSGKQQDLSEAYALQREGNYALCLFSASKIKAEADVILSASSVNAEQLDDLLENKLAAVRRNIADQISQDIFPILGYSYLEYAQSLADTDPYSALLYSEYALELSNMDLYFKREENKMDAFFSRIDERQLLVFSVGLILGIFIGLVFRFTTPLPQHKVLQKKSPLKSRR